MVNCDMFPALSPQHCQNLKELHFAGPNESGTIWLLSSARFHSQQLEGVLQAMNPACTLGGGGMTRIKARTSLFLAMVILT